MTTANQALTTIQADIYSVQDHFEQVRVDKSMSFVREAGFAIQILGQNDYAMQIALGNRQSVVDAVLNIAAIGISLNPAKKQAYLVPRDRKICLDVSYIGLMDLAMSTGAIRWAQAAIVRSADAFTLHGFDKPPTHTFNPFATDDSRGEPVGVYVVVKTSDGDYLTHTMPIADVFAIRDRSSAWKAWIEKKKRCPWVTDEAEMVKKTCVKQAYKYWPKVERLSEAIKHLDNEGEGLAELAENTLDSGRELRIVSSPTDGVQLVDDSRMAIVRAVASAIVDHFDKDDISGAYEEYQGITDGEEKVALWKELKEFPKVRAAIKKHGETIREEA